MVEHKDMHSMRGGGAPQQRGGRRSGPGQEQALLGGGCGAGPHQASRVAGAGRAVRLGTRWVPSA